jgi:hypothetical protein
MSILAGMLIPAVSKARGKARYVRWIGYNASWNRDPDTVLNFSFEYDDFYTEFKGGRFPALKNGAVGCGIEGFEPSEYNGVMINEPEWRKRCGRWGLNNSLQFDGKNDFVYIPGTLVLDFVPSSSDFTAVVWMNPDRLSGIQTFFSKSEWMKSAQYDAYLWNKKLEADVGTSAQSWNNPEGLEEGKWHCVVLRNEDGNFDMFFNGRGLAGGGSAIEGGDEMSNSNFILGAAGRSGTTDLNTGRGRENGKGKSKDKKENIQIQKTGYYFGGMIDEMLLIGRALSDSEIEGIYKMGNPY